MSGALKFKGSSPFPTLFFPEKLTISHSLKKEWLTCRRKFLLKYLGLLEPKKIFIPFFVGGFFHDGLESFYKKEDPEVFIPELREKMMAKAKEAVFLTPEEEQDLDQQIATVEGMVAAYCIKYAKDLSKWKIIATEMEFEIPITDDISYAGKIDGVVKIGDEHFVLEHKTVGRLDRDYVTRLGLDTQITGYIIGARKKLGIPIKGIIYNVAKKPKIRQRNGETPSEFAERLTKDYLEIGRAHV